MTTGRTVGPIPRLGAYEALCWALRRRQLFEIHGSSMYPALSSGERVLVDRRSAPAVGDVVVARHPYRTDTVMIKRVAVVDARGRYVLRGDNPSQSSDSRTFGAVPVNLLIGVVTCRLVGRGPRPANTGTEQIG